MNNLLSTVKIESTLRIKASSTLEAANAAFKSVTKREIKAVSPVAGDDCAFICYSVIECSPTTTIHCFEVAYVDPASRGFRVEVGKVELTEIEYKYLIGGDELVNKSGVYKDDCTKIINSNGYKEEVAYWSEKEKAGDCTEGMAVYIKSKYTKMTCINGQLIKG